MKEKKMEKTMYPKYRWYVMFVMFLIHICCAGMILISPAPLVGEISKASGWQLGTITVIMMSAFTFFVAGGCVIAAFVLDKIGVCKTYMLGCILSIAGAFLMPILGSTIPGLVFLRLLEALGASFALASPMLIASEWFPLEERGIVTGFQGAGVGLGTTVGVVISPILFNATGNWLTTMALFGIPPILCFILVLIMKFGPNAPVVQNEAPAENLGVQSDSDFKLALKERLFIVALLILFFFNWSFQGFNGLVPGYLAVDPPVGVGLGAQAAGNTFSFYSLFFMIGAICSGFIGRFVFKNKLKTPLVLAFIMGAIFKLLILLPGFKDNQTALTACFIIAGFFFTWTNPMTFAYLTQCYPKSVMGRIGGILQGLGTLGAPIGVAVGSFVLNATNSYYIPLGLISFMCLLGFLLTLFLYKPKIFADQIV
jgi:MFS family permease